MISVNYLKQMLSAWEPRAGFPMDRDQESWTWFQAPNMFLWQELRIHDDDDELGWFYFYSQLLLNIGKDQAYLLLPTYYLVTVYY